MEKKQMPHEHLTWFQRLQEYGFFGYIWLILFAAWAGIAKYTSERIKAGERPTLGGALLHTVAPAFVGIVTGFICQSYNVDQYMTNALVGVAAFNGVKSIDFISAILKKEIPIKKDIEKCYNSSTIKGVVTYEYKRINELSRKAAQLT